MILGLHVCFTSLHAAMSIYTTKMNILADFALKSKGFQVTISPEPASFKSLIGTLFTHFWLIDFCSPYSTQLMYMHLPGVRVTTILCVVPIQ